MDKRLSVREIFQQFLLLIVLVKCVLSEETMDFIREQPSYLKPCKIYEPGFTKCSTSSVQELMTAIAKGLPELEGKVDSLDPLKLKLVQFAQNDGGPANIRANLTDLDVTGFSQMKIKESRVSKKDFSWLTTIYLPKVRLEGQYVMDGRILLLSLQGKGHMFIELYDLNVVMRTKNRLISKDGFTFYNITGLSTEIEIGNLKTKFDNLFGGNNEEVARTTNESFNQNWREFFESLRPLIQETVEQILFNILHKIFLIYPANFFIEDIPTPEKLYGQSSTKH